MGMKSIILITRHAKCVTKHSIIGIKDIYFLILLLEKDKY